jgi:hypothetical protein
LIKRGFLKNRTVDLDSTVKTSYGKQEGVAKGYNPHKRGAKSYHPLLAFCSYTKEILQGWLRTGNAYTANGVIAFVQQMLAHVPSSTHLIFRCDSGFFSGLFMDFLDKLNHGYLIKAKLTKPLKEFMQSQLWLPVPGQAGFEYCEFGYMCGTWSKFRRFVAIRRKIDECRDKRKLNENHDGYDYYCYVLTEALTPWEAHKEYGKRATCETLIEEAKNQMGLGQIKTDDFFANSALFQCAILAYNTICWMRLFTANQTIKCWEIKTIRMFLIRVAGKLVSTGRILILKLPEGRLFSKQLDTWMNLTLQFQ